MVVLSSPPISIASGMEEDGLANEIHAGKNLYGNPLPSIYD
jgi:hypothetical protein